MTNLVSALYIFLGFAMVALTIVRWKAGLEPQAVITFLWALLVWRLGIRYYSVRGPHDLGLVSDWLGRPVVIGAQLFILSVGTVFMMMLDWEERRRPLEEK